MARNGSVLGALAQFAIGGVLATLVLGFAGVAVLRDYGRDEAARDAKRTTTLIARGIVQPELSDGLFRGDPAAIRRLDRALRTRVLNGDPVVRVKLWAPDGRVVYSDEQRLLGKRFELDDEERDVLRHGGVQADLSDLSRPENRYEPRDRRLFEVYTPVRTPSGRKLVLEVYHRYSAVTASARSTWMSFLPALLGGLVILQLLQLPLAARMARRVKRERIEREQLLSRAVHASESERRRIAADLHDGVVQSLAGTSFALAAAADRASRNGGAEYDVLREGAAATRSGLAELRTLLVKIHPPGLQSAGLAVALDDLVTPLRRRGLDVGVDVQCDALLPPGVEALFFRVAQEAVSHTAARASAQRVDIEVGLCGRTAELEVRSDGAGFDPVATQLTDLVRDAGGALSVVAAPGARIGVQVDLA
jgi:two-component system, NarL family, sensor kinase